MSDSSQQVTYSAAQLRENLPELDEAHPHAGLVQDAGKRRLISYLASVHEGDIEATDIYRDIVRNEATDSITDAVAEGNISEMQYAVGMVSNEHEYSDPATRMWLKGVIVSDAYIGWVTGGPGAGKTSWAFDRADDWQDMVELGAIGTNVESAAKQNEEIEFVPGHEELAAFYRENQHCFMVLDETDQSLSGKGSNQQHGDALASTLKLVRKGEYERAYRGILLVGQTVRGATKDLRRLVAQNGHLYHKPSKKTVEIYDDPVSGEIGQMKPIKEITKVPDTRFDYRTGEASEFDVSGFVEEEGLSEKEKDIKTAVRAVALQGLSAREAASLVDFGKTWVNDRVNDWENGDYRDVVGLSPSDVES